ncbi:MAG: non-hydrolyzing UDP-N-acetylglucosamine 2-epimerase [Chloroflexota bacterium]
MIRVLSVVGTRPEAIKMAPIIRELNCWPDRISSRVCVTSQHRDMLDQVLEVFGLKPHHDLEVMEENQTPTQVASAVLLRLTPILRREQPDWVLVQGDTTTVLAASLAAFYAGVPVAHVEAGLRTHRRYRPFPEELNRRLVAVLATCHFAPTLRARQNLLREGVSCDRIWVTGNSVIDALRSVADRPTTAAVKELFQQLGLRVEAAAGSQSRGLSAAKSRARASDRGTGEVDSFRSARAKSKVPHSHVTSPHLVLVTAHRRENHGQPLRDICLALAEIAARGGVEIVYPVHPSPNVWNPVQEHLDGVTHITLIPPLDYLSLVQVMKRAQLVLTDSGGIQEEAPALGVPVLVLRQETERPEGVDATAACVVGTDRRRIVAETCRLLDDPAARARMSRGINLYGDGRASQRIVAALLGDPVDEFSARSGERCSGLRTESLAARQGGITGLEPTPAHQEQTTEDRP